MNRNRKVLKLLLDSNAALDFTMQREAGFSDMAKIWAAIKRGLHYAFFAQPCYIGFVVAQFCKHLGGVFAEQGRVALTLGFELVIVSHGAIIANCWTQ